ncbi:DUF6879 family protein [Actinomadura sp. NAK00032]|uniref:DUF6879 family protein n=1 Tax=Actinomadura sp. NAK00032 TaxID=2742128 RepID=UPI0034A1E516
MSTIPTPADLLASARVSAVHLEMRDAYAVDREDEEFKAWKAGYRDDPGDPASWWRPWLSLVQEVNARGSSTPPSWSSPGRPSRARPPAS